MDLLQPLLFWKGGTGELTAKTKGSDRILPKMGVSLPLFNKNSTPNGEGCVLTPKGCFPTSKYCIPTMKGYSHPEGLCAHPEGLCSHC